MNKIIIAFCIVLCCSMAEAGDFVFHTGETITGKRSSCGAVCSQRLDALRVDKATYESTTIKYHKVVDDVVVEMSQGEKDAVDQAEADAQKQAQIDTVNALEVSVKDLAKALVQLGIVNGADLKTKIKEINGIAP